MYGVTLRRPVAWEHGADPVPAAGDERADPDPAVWDETAILYRQVGCISQVLGEGSLRYPEYSKKTWIVLGGPLKPLRLSRHKDGPVQSAVHLFQLIESELLFFAFLSLPPHPGLPEMELCAPFLDLGCRTVSGNSPIGGGTDQQGAVSTHVRVEKATKSKSGELELRELWSLSPELGILAGMILSAR